MPRLVLLLLLPLALTACAGQRAATSSEPLTYTVADIDARGVGGHFAFFSLRENRLVPVADSASTAWDLAFRSTTVLVNGGTSGPGMGGAVVLEDTNFAAVTEAPADEAFAADTGTDRTETAIPGGAGNGWYDYDFVSGIVSPRPVVLAVRTADGRYAKVEIQSYYLGAPALADLDPSKNFRYYTFRVLFQPDGSRRLEG
ncbi:MAG: HmuY family protein [Bacteroidota bacterium]